MFNTFLIFVSTFMIVLVTVGLRGDRVDGARLRGRGDGVAETTSNDVDRGRRVRARFCLFIATKPSRLEQRDVKPSRLAVETTR